MKWQYFILPQKYTLLVSILFWTIPDLNGRHQLCRPFPWVDSPEIPEVSPQLSASLTNCTTIKIYLVPHSLHLFHTISTTNRHSQCSSYQIDTIVVTLVAQQNPNIGVWQPDTRAVSIGTWSPILTENRPRKKLPPLPPRFPSQYISNGEDTLAVLECASLETYDDQVDNFIRGIQTSQLPNTLIFNSILDPTSGIAAELEVNVPSSDIPTPVQIAIEFLITNKATGESSYWTWNSKDLILDPQTQNIKWSNSKYNRVLYLDPAYYERTLTLEKTRFTRQNNTNSTGPIGPPPSNNTNSTGPVVPTPPPPPPPTPPPPPPLIPRESHMCECVNPRRQNGKQSAQILDTLPGAIVPCISFKIASCTKTHTQELLGAQFIINSLSNGCPAGIKVHDISVIALNDLGFPYGRIAVNQQMNMCFNTGNTIDDPKKAKPVLNNLNVVEYECTKYATANPQSLFPLPKWITINADAVSEGAGFTGFEGTVFQFVLQDEVKSASRPQAPTSLQFVAEFGVEQTPGSYAMYRIRTEHLELAYNAANKVDVVGGQVLPADIVPDPTYIGAVTPPTCQPPKPNGGRGPFKPYICECLKKCGNCSQTSAIDGCFEVDFNPPSTAGTPFEFYMSFRKKTTNCQFSNIIFTDVQFTVLQREIGDLNSKPAGEWSMIDDADKADYTTVGKCIDAPDPTIKPKRSGSQSGRNCKGTSNQTLGLFWHYRQFSTIEAIVCARWKYTPRASGKNVEIQAGFSFLYKTTQTGQIEKYEGMHDIYEVAPGATLPNLVYGEKNDRLKLVTYDDFSKTCVQGPVTRDTDMCDCVNPYRPSGQVWTKPVLEFDQVTTGFRNCFEFKMVECGQSHTGENLGAMWIQNGKSCGSVQLHSLDMSVIAINELGYPYGELEVNLVSNECFDATTNPILNYRPVVNEYHIMKFPCNSLKNKGKTLYGSKTPSWISINLDLKASSSDLTSHAVQFILKEPVETTSNPHPTSLQFIAEFQVKETPTGITESYRIATEHRTLAFTGGKVNLAGSQVVTAEPRIELHPDYVDDDAPSCSSNLSTVAKPPGPNLDWTTCHCFEWEKPTESTVATAAQVTLLKNCMAMSFSHDTTSGANPTFFVNIAKTPTSGSQCSDIVIQSIVLTMLGRKKTGEVKTMVPEGKWERADLATEYVTGKCYPSGGAGNTANYVPQKTGSTSPRDCAKPGSSAALYFFYRGLQKDKDVHCAKWQYSGAPVYEEIQVLFKIHFFQNSQANSLKIVERFPLIYEVNGAVVKKISREDEMFPRMDLLLAKDPNENKNASCIITPFVPSSDMCDCTPIRHGGFNQIPDRSIVEELSNSIPPIDPSCFEFTIVPCTVGGEEFDTIGALLVFKGQNQASTCTSNIKVQDIAFGVINQNGYPFGTPKHHEFSRVCLQPQDLLKYRIRKLDFSHPVGSECNTRTKPGGGNYNQEFQYGGRTPSWLQVNTNVELQTLDKPIALQIYLEKPNPKTNANQIQFIAEMAIEDVASKGVKLYRIKTKVYDIGYHSLPGGTLQYDPTLLLVNTGIPTIEREEGYYETENKNNSKCHVPPPTPRTKVPFSVQTCRCFKFAEGNPPTGTVLNPTSLLYTDKFEKCVFFETSVDQDPGNGDYFFYLTIWSKTVQEEAVCGDFQVVGVSLSQMLQKIKPGTTEQIGESFNTNGDDWMRTTMPSPASWVVQDPTKSRGLYCAINPSYKGKLRRLPPNHDDFNVKCEKTKTVGHGFLFYYPLMHNSDSGNAFCASLKIGSPALQRDRFEFQISGYFFMDFTVPQGKWFAMKRTFIFEFFKAASAPPNPSPPPTTAATINFPSWVFAVQEPGQVATDCKTDFCYYP